ncbi:MAG TPA: hypothetical protein VJ375_09510, partial [Gaiellaceae bacterium]|nr:hypothetical protein [Gaiellaceae bacterium]
MFEYRGRLDGRIVNRKLAARNKTAAAAEVEKLRSTARTSDHVTVDRTLTVARLAEKFRQAAEADPAISPRTREDWLTRIDLHVVPTLGRLRVCDLDAHAVRRFARGLPKMRSKTHRNVLSVLSVLLAWAVAEGLASENPVSRARERFPRDLRRTDATKFEPRALTDAEVKLALAKVGATYRPLVTFIAETGARVSEALGVRFRDVDLQAGTWTVAGQLADDG